MEIFLSPSYYLSLVWKGSFRMMLGMSLSTFTTVHVIISLVGIASGLIVLFGMFSSKRLDGLTALFLSMTVLTSVTGFMFPFTHLTPGHKVGFISLVVLVIAILARYSFHWWENGAGYSWSPPSLPNI